MAANGNGKKKKFPGNGASLASGRSAVIAEATVLPPAYQLIQDANEIVLYEVAAMKRLVRQNKDRDGPVSALDAREVGKLRQLVGTMRDTHALEGEAIEREGLSRLSRKELLELLKKELASDNGASQ